MRALALALLLAGCAGGPPVARGLSLVPDGGGLAVEGPGGGRIDFGRAEAGALDAVARATGRRPRAVECGILGRRAWDAGRGLILVTEGSPFDAGDGARLVGWRRGDAQAGLGCV